ncbi:MAG TPA: SDR family oxidoreductase [Chitinispirillaceae bacterium]|nr:SDR family oxidoreductase [Chitinispirillaceae bacterium]
MEHHGLNLSRNPFDMENESYEKAPPKQQQPWPASEQPMNPKVDHGEENYQGGAKLVGLKALVTGGDSGIGRAISIAFAREGADVALTYYEERDDALETVGWIQEAGHTGRAFQADLRDHQDCEAVVDRAYHELNGLNILINNAAIHIEKQDVTEISPEQLENTFKTNIFSFFWVTQSALKYLKAGDTIINTGSVTGIKGHKSLTDYAATKGAIHTFTKSLALELAPKGIRVNCVSPGPVWTPLISATRDAQHVSRFGEDTLWGRPAQPCEIAPSFVFLASTDSRFYTGEILYPAGSVLNL